MSELRVVLGKQFSEKVYPDINDPSIVEKINEGRRLFCKKYLGRSYPWVLGKFLGFGSEEGCDWFRTINPATQKTVATFPIFPGPRMSQSSVMEALKEVRSAGRNFAKTVPWQERILLLLEISKVVKENFWLLVAAMQYETGQSIMEAIGEADEAVDFPLATAMYLQELNKELLLASPPFAGDYNGKRYVQHGVFLNIAPFNFPVAIPMDMACKALAMGNAIIEKSSDKSSLCGYLMIQMIKEAFERRGISHKGVVNYVPGGPKVVDLLLQSPDISGVSFTGSSAALTEIKRKHGAMLRNKFRGRAPLSFASAETSGVNVVVVWSDADVEYAASECLKSFIGRQGQKCSSARVILVHNDIIREFVFALERKLRAVRFGAVLDGADVGKVITKEAEDRIMRTIKSLMRAEVVDNHISLNKNEGSAPGILLASPEVLTNDTKALKLMNTEIFGPVATVVSVPDLPAIERLCDFSDFALTGSYFCADMDVCLALGDIIPAGNLYHNRKCTGALVESECFGGLCSLSSPTGIKGKHALALFGSEQICPGFYPVSWRYEDRVAFVRAKEKRGFVFSKM